MQTLRLSLGAAVVSTGMLAAGSVAAADAEFAESVRPFLQRHCVGCHGPHKQNAQLRYDRLEGFRPEDGPLWTRVHEVLSTGAMPPEDRPRPTTAERDRVLSWIQLQQQAVSVGARRLNRRELSAALQDVTGLRVDYAAAMPEDGRLAGFDTGADALQDTADSVARLLEVTRRAVEAIRFLEPDRTAVFQKDFRQAGRDLRRAFDDWAARGGKGKIQGSVRPGEGVLLEPLWLGDRSETTLTVPCPERRGVLRIRLRAAVVKNRPELPNPRLWVKVGSTVIDYPEITAPADRPQELTYYVQLDDLAVGSDGASLNLSGRIEVPYSVAGFENEDKTRPGENVPGGTGWFRPAFDRKKLPRELHPVPFVLLEQVEIDADHVSAWPPAEWGAKLGPLSDTPECAEKLLTLWMDRAWRRPTTDVERAPFLSLYRRLRGRQLSFDDALRGSFQAVLLSGQFRTLASPGDADGVTAQYAIASRLSFLLWGAPPDTQLRRLAGQGRLREPSVLDEQVDRLLADPRADGFLRPFVTQWLELDQPITLAMDHIKKQDFRFGRNLKAALREETVAYVSELFTGNRPARELIDSDWTYMNDILAVHYGYRDIVGGHLRRVKLRPDDPRGGGVLGHAGIQSMLCWMGDNWVIYRGAWTLRHILDDPPPPPPLEVPELLPSDKANHGKSFKQLLEQHQRDVNCSVCHRKMDPLGFAFQNFDLSGRWRDVEYDAYARTELDGKIEWRGLGNTRPVDTVGRLPRGEAFRSFRECKNLIVAGYLPDVVSGVLKNLTVVAAGRKPSVQDLAELRAIADRHAAAGWPMRELLKSLIRSRIFLGR